MAGRVSYSVHQIGDVALINVLLKRDPMANVVHHGQSVLQVDHEEHEESFRNEGRLFEQIGTENLFASGQGRVGCQR